MVGLYFVKWPPFCVGSELSWEFRHLPADWLSISAINSVRETVLLEESVRIMVESQ